MTKKLNQFGYYVDNDGAFMTPTQLATFTGNVFSSSSETLEAVLLGVSNAIRGYCGWHVGPNTECEWTGDADGALVRLPARTVTAVKEVSVDGVQLDASEYSWRTSGLIRLKHPLKDDWGRRVTVTFDSGIDPSVLQDVVAQIATNALVAPAGVRSEQAGDVSISYNTTSKEGGTGGVRLLESDKQQLDPFKLTC